MLLYSCIIFFTISLGALRLQYSENPDAPFNNSITGKLSAFFGTILNIGMIYIVLLNLFHLRWYANIAIVLVSAFGFSSFLAILYGNAFGIKTDPQISIKEAKAVRYHLRIYDALITFVVGLVLFIFWDVV